MQDSPSSPVVAFEAHITQRLGALLSQTQRLTYDVYPMIRSFRCPESESLSNDRNVRRFRCIERAVRRRLFYLHRAAHLQNPAE